MKSLTVSEEASVVTELPAHLGGKTLTVFEATQVFYVDFQCDHRGKKMFFLHLCTWNSLEQTHKGKGNHMECRRTTGHRVGAARAVWDQKLVL